MIEIKDTSIFSITDYVERQLLLFFPDADLPPSRSWFRRRVIRAIERIEECFQHIRLPGYDQFDHLHGDQYASFLYILSNEVWKNGEPLTAKKIFLLNKALNGIVVMYDTELPKVFVLLHTVGTVLGKAQYGNFFVAGQNVTVGTDNGAEPIIGERVVMYGGSSIVGNAIIPPRVTLSANSTVRGAQYLEPGSVVAGVSPNNIVKPARRQVSDLYFK